MWNERHAFYCKLTCGLVASVLLYINFDKLIYSHSLMSVPQSETLVFSYHRLVFTWPIQHMCMSMAG